MINFEQWEGFEGRIWKEEVNVRDFIQKNYTPYDGDESFLAGPTEATDKLWGALQQLQKDSEAIRSQYAHYFDLSLVNNGVDETLKQLQEALGEDEELFGKLKNLIISLEAPTE